jgi:hypothetical protein
MPKDWKLLILSAALVAGLMPTASAAASPRVPAGLRYFSGTTSIGGEVQFRVKRTSTGRLKLAGWFIWAPLTCDDATVVTDHAYGYGYSPYLRLDGRRLDYSTDDLDVRYRIVGTFRNHAASGWLTFRVAAFTADGTPQSCDTGRVDWTATA